MPAAMRILSVIILLSLLYLTPCPALQEDRPSIIIYTGSENPGYASVLREIIEEDGRIDGDIQILDSPDIFRLMLYFPGVKVAIISSSAESDDGLGEAIQWFFSRGGGLVSLGLASSDLSIGTASETVFPIFGTTFRTGTMDPEIRKFRLTHVKETEDEISLGLGDFTVIDHKILLSFNKTTNSYVPRVPESGSYRVLYREKETGAPSVVKYESTGASVTFASFGGDDFESGFAYHGLYSYREEFRALFANSVFWVWTNEVKNGPSMETAVEFYQYMQEDISTVREEALRNDSRARNNLNFRIILTIGLALIGSVIVYRVTFKTRMED